MKHIRLQLKRRKRNKWKSFFLTKINGKLGKKKQAFEAIYFCLCKNITN